MDQPLDCNHAPVAPLSPAAAARAPARRRRGRDGVGGGHRRAQRRAATRRAAVGHRPHAHRAAQHVPAHRADPGTDEGLLRGRVPVRPAGADPRESNPRSRTDTRPARRRRPSSRRSWRRTCTSARRSRSAGASTAACGWPLREQTPDRRRRPVHLLPRVASPDRGSRRGPTASRARRRRRACWRWRWRVAFGSRLVRRVRDLDARTRLIAAGDFRPMPVPPPTTNFATCAKRSTTWPAGSPRSRRNSSAPSGCACSVSSPAACAHQLRNAATGAKLAVELFLQENPPADPEPLRVALRQLARIESNLRQFLELGKPPDGSEAGVRPRAADRSVGEPVEAAVSARGHAASLVRPTCRSVHAGRPNAALAPVRQRDRQRGRGGRAGRHGGGELFPTPHDCNALRIPEVGFAIEVIDSGPGPPSEDRGAAVRAVRDRQAGRNRPGPGCGQAGCGGARRSIDWAATRTARRFSACDLPLVE